jgi:hypothetical protein
LLASHLNALVASEIGMPGLDDMGMGRPSIMRLVTDDNDKMPLAKEVRSGLELVAGRPSMTSRPPLSASSVISKRN